MDIAKCEVRLSGDLANSVPLSNVTPAEVLVLRAIHGEDSVVRIQQTGTDRRPHKDEYERLAQKYSQSKTSDDKPVFTQIFPSAFDPRLPVSFKDIGVDTTVSADAPVADLPDLADTDETEEVNLIPELESELSEASEDEAPARRGRKPRAS
jgi:hypothetical protein